MPTIKTYRKVGAFYIACEEDFPTPIGTETSLPSANLVNGMVRRFRLRDSSGVCPV